MGRHKRGGGGLQLGAGPPPIPVYGGRGEGFDP